MKSACFDGSIFRLPISCCILIFPLYLIDTIKVMRGFTHHKGSGMTDEKLIDCHEVVRLTTLTRSGIYSLMRRGLFPRPIKIGTKAIRWRENEVRAYIEDRPQGGVEPQLSNP